jgi:hypothetical protein
MTHLVTCAGTVPGAPSALSGRLNVKEPAKNALYLLDNAAA